MPTRGRILCAAEGCIIFSSYAPDIDGQVRCGRHRNSVTDNPLTWGPWDDHKMSIEFPPGRPDWIWAYGQRKCIREKSARFDAYLLGMHLDGWKTVGLARLHELSQPAVYKRIKKALRVRREQDHE